MTATIKTTCGCGKSLQAKPELAGKRVKCPACGEPLVVPKPKGIVEKIRVSCECGRTFSAKPQLAGRRVKCPSCGNPLSIPMPMPIAAASKAPESPEDPFGLGDLDDLAEQSVAAPAKLRQPRKDYEAEAKQKEKSTKTKRRRQTDSSMDPLTAVAGVACILHGLGGPVVTSRIVWAVLRATGLGGITNLLMSVQGFVAIASVIVGIGFIACGVGFLVRQPWAAQLAYTLALTYIGLLVVGVLGQLVVTMQHGGTNIIPMLLVNAVKRSVPQLLVPIFIIYLARRD